MVRNPRQSGLSAILGGRCPRCREGAIHRGLLRLNPQCPVCGLVFDREEGYFTGAMYVSFLLSVPIVGLLVTAFAVLTRWGWEQILLGAFLAYLVFVPWLVRVSRVLWIHFDRFVDRWDRRQSPPADSPR